MADEFSSQMQIILVRHANCAKMADVLLGRIVDGPLDERGEGQARVVAKRLLAFPQLIVESSPRRRARHTAGIIAALRDTTVRIVPQMDEVDFGYWAGQSFQVLAADPQPHRVGRMERAATGAECLHYCDELDQLQTPTLRRAGLWSEGHRIQEIPAPA